MFLEFCSVKKKYDSLKLEQYITILIGLSVLFYCNINLLFDLNSFIYTILLKRHRVCTDRSTNVFVVTDEYSVVTLNAVMTSYRQRHSCGAKHSTPVYCNWGI